MQRNSSRHWSGAFVLAATAASGILPARLAAQTENVIFSFNDPQFAASACGNLQISAGLLYLNDRLYGTTPSGGTGELGLPTTRDGVAFGLTIPQGDQTEVQRNILHSFVNDVEGDGLYPCARLIAGPRGAMYGTTMSGGAHGLGAVFMLTHPSGQKGWTERVLYSFQGGSDGALPAGGLTLDASGNLYGATSGGGNSNNGTVFELIKPPSGDGFTETVLYRFNGGDDGYVPNGDLLLDSNTGALFGTTLYGGLYEGGTVFSVTPVAGTIGIWSKATLWAFDSASAAYSAATPNGGLLGGTGALFGTTQNGGAQPLAGDCCGVVFFLWQEYADNPIYTLVVLHQFADGADGSTPLAGLFEDSSGTFWGSTATGGASELGTVFKLVPDPIRVEDWHYSVVYSFQGGSDGATPESPLTTDGTALYGTTSAGGVYNGGTVYKLTP